MCCGRWRSVTHIKLRPLVCCCSCCVCHGKRVTVASQAPYYSSSTGFFVDAYAAYSIGCQTEVADCWRGGALALPNRFPKHFKVSGSEGPLTVSSSGHSICSVIQQHLEQQISGLEKCDASSILLSLQLPTSGIASQFTQLQLQLLLLPLASSCRTADFVRSRMS